MVYLYLMPSYTEFSMIFHDLIAYSGMIHSSPERNIPDWNESFPSLCMGSVPDYRVCFRGLFHLNPDYRWPDHEPDLVTHRVRGLHREDDGGDLVVTIEHNGTLIVGKNRVCS